MLLHNIKLAFQQMRKYRLQSAVSIVSLAIGFACFALAMLWIRYERTFDTQHPDADRLYMVYQKEGLIVREPLAGYLASNLPEAEMVTKIVPGQNTILIDGVKHEINEMQCDSSFLKTMGIRVVSGNADFWMHRHQYAVTEEFAAKVWGKENPIGKTFKSVWNDQELTVTAVVSSYGQHTNILFDIIYGETYELNWYSSRGYALVCLNQRADGEAFVQKMDTFVVKVPETVHDWGKGGAFDYSGLSAVPLGRFRQVLSDSGETSTLSSATGLVQFRHIRIIALAGILLIMSGLLNYLTLFLNRIFIRHREVVLRSVFGATTRNIMAMLFTEYALLLVIALGCGLLFIEALLPWFRGITGIASVRHAIYGETAIYSAVVMVVGFILSVPVIGYFRRKSAQHSLQGRGVQHTYKSFRKLSVVVQMTISIGFIFCTAVMMMQLEKLRHTNPGFERQNMAVLNIYDDNDHKAFAQQLNQIPEIKEWHEGYSLFPRNGMIGFSLGVGGTDKRIYCNMVLGAKDYQQFYGLQLKEGRWIEEGDKDCAVVTESAVKEMDVEKPIGTRLEQSKKQGYTIVGVVEDIFYKGPSDKAENHLFCNDLYGSSYGHGLYLIKYHKGTWDSLSKKLNDMLKNTETGKNTYSLKNCEEEYDKIILSELTLRKLMTAVSLVCILISLFGIWSMIMLDCEQNRKEIAVRKVFGAKVSQVLAQFITEYLLLLVAAAIIAFPIGYAGMKPWIEQYIIQTELPWWLFVGIFLLITLLVTLCIGWRVWKTARAHAAEEIARG